MRTTIRMSMMCGALLAALIGPGCDAEDTEARAGTVDLSRYGVGAVEAEADGAYRLLDELGQEIGRVDRAVEGSAVAISVEFAGHSAELAWSSADASVACDADPTALGDCAEGLNIAAELAEADGIDVPAFTASADDGVDFRVACETISTWVGGGSCSGCLAAAQDVATSGYAHDSGSCSAGGFYTTCTHTFCGGGSEQQLAMNAH